MGGGGHGRICLTDSATVHIYINKYMYICKIFTPNYTSSMCRRERLRKRRRRAAISNLRIEFSYHKILKEHPHTPTLVEPSALNQLIRPCKPCFIIHCHTSRQCLNF